MEQEGILKFRVVDLDILSNENVFNRYVDRMNKGNANTLVQTSVNIGGGSQDRQPLPPNVTDFIVTELS